VSVINRTIVKRKLLQLAADTRSHKFTRVSKASLDHIEALVEAWIRDHVHRFPSKGQTL
jgi:hypothetical protein